MKKLFLLIAAASFIVPASYAQTVTTSEDEETKTIVEESMTPEGRVVTTTVYQKNSVFTNGFWHNWTLGGAVGAQLYYGDNDWKVKGFGEMITIPSFDLFLTKWASPNFGVGLGVSGGPFKGLYQSASTTNINPHFTTTDFYKDADSKYDYEKLALQKGSYINTYVLAHTDLGNLFYGYDPDRFFDIDAYAGGGLIFGLNDKYARGTTFNLGLNNMFRVNEMFRINVNVKGAFVSDEFDGESYIKEPDESHIKANHKFDGIAGVTVGFTYNLGREKSKWTLANRSSTIHYNDAILAQNAALAAQLGEANAKIGDLENQIREMDKIQYIKEVPDLWFHINFVVDKWDLSRRELINLQSVAEIIKDTPKTKYLVVGYADKQTATPDHNLTLSKNRVEAVYNYLVNELGVDPSQLITDYKGGVDYMFYNDNELSRCVMINTIKEE